MSCISWIWSVGIAFETYGICGRLSVELVVYISSSNLNARFGPGKNEWLQMMTINFGLKISSSCSLCIRPLKQLYKLYIIFSGMHNVQATYMEADNDMDYFQTNVKKQKNHFSITLLLDTIKGNGRMWLISTWWTIFIVQ